MSGAVVASLAAALVFWASAFVGIRAAVGSFTPGHLALLRFVVACGCLLVLARQRRMPLPRLAHVPSIFWHGFLGFYVYHVALNQGLRSISAASGCFLIGSIPVFVALFAMFMLGERLGARGWAGIAVSFCGLALIALGEGAGVRIEAGALWVLLAALAESLYYVSIKRRLQEYGTVTYTTYTIFAGAALMLMFAPGLGTEVMQAPASATLAVVYLGIFPTAVAYICWNYAVSKADVSRVAVTQYLMPFLTIVLGWLLLGEMPPALAVVGGVVAVAGVVLVNARWARRTRAAEGVPKGPLVRFMARGRKNGS
jgi:drug/metabolite transporter (DMT)-like permease